MYGIFEKNPYTEKNLYVHKFLGSKNSKMMKFSWKGTMLRTDVTHCSYIMQQFFAPCNFVANSTCYTTMLHYGVMLWCFVTCLHPPLDKMSVYLDKNNTSLRTKQIHSCRISHTGATQYRILLYHGNISTEQSNTQIVR